MRFELLSIPSRREVKFIHSNSRVSVGERVAPLIVTSVAFSPDGRYVASSSGNGEVKLWDLARKRNIWTKKHGNFVGALAFSPDGDVLASGGSEGTVKFWQIRLRARALEHCKPLLSKNLSVRWFSLLMPLSCTAV